MPNLGSCIELGAGSVKNVKFAVIFFRFCCSRSFKINKNIKKLKNPYYSFVITRFSMVNNSFATIKFMFMFVKFSLYFVNLVEIKCNILFCTQIWIYEPLTDHLHGHVWRIRVPTSLVYTILTIGEIQLC